MKKLFIISIAAVTILTGCNTVSGVGRDIAWVGDSISDVAVEKGKSQSNNNNNYR